MRTVRVLLGATCLCFISALAQGAWQTSAGGSSIDIGAGTAVAASSDGYYGLLTLRYSGANLYAQRTDPVADPMWGAGAPEGVLLTGTLDTSAGLQVIGSATDDGMRGGYFAWTEDPSLQEVHVARINIVAATPTILFDVVVSPAGKDCHSPRLLKMASGVLVVYVNDTDGVSSLDGKIASVIELALVANDGTVMKRAQLMAMHPEGQLLLLPDSSGGVIIVWDLPSSVSSTVNMPDASLTWALRMDENLVSVWERIDDDPLYRRRGETATVAPDGEGGLWVAGRRDYDDAGVYSIADNGEFVMVNHLLSDGTYDWASWVKALEWDSHEKRDYDIERSPGEFYPASDVIFTDYQTDQHTPRLVADGSGGVYVLAKDDRMYTGVAPTSAADEQLYAQHLTSKGQLQWDANQTGGYFSGTITPVATPLPVYDKDYGWAEGAEVRNSSVLKQQPIAESKSWWGYDTFGGHVLNAPFVSIWAEGAGAAWDINAVELDPDGGMQTTADPTWGAAPIPIKAGVSDQSEATGTGIFTVSHERFGTYIVWTNSATVQAAHLNFFEMWALCGGEAIGPGPDLFAPGPVTNLQALPQPGWVELSWANPGRLVYPPLGVNSNKPFDDFEGVTIIRTTDGPALSPYDYPEHAWRDAGPAETYSDFSVEAGVTYYYTAFAHDTTFAQFNFSTPVWTSVSVPLGDVEDFLALGAGTDTIGLSWTIPGSASYVGIEIWRDTVGYPTDPGVPGTATLVQRVLATDAVPSSWTDTGLTSNTKYYYASFPLEDPVGTPLATLGARAVAATVGGVTTFTATERDKGVDLTWDNPTVDPTPGTFDGIVICRVEGSVPPTSPDDGPLTVDPIPNLIGQPGAHVDGNVVNGTEYAYAAFAAYTFGGDRVYAVPGTSSAIPIDRVGPDPITNFVASIQTVNGIHLSWLPPVYGTPSNTDLTGLIIVRKVGGYPTSVVDGIVVLTDVLAPPTDTVLENSLDDDETQDDPPVVGPDLYYYAAWTYDAQTPPNYSVIALATPPLAPVSNLPPEITAGPTGAATDHDSATIGWTARDHDVDTMTAVVSWGLDATSLLPGHAIRWMTSSSIICPDNVPVTFVIDDLKSGATYLYEVTVTDSTGQTVTEQGIPFTTDAPLADFDGDGLPDAWEVLYNTDPANNPLDWTQADSGSTGSLDDDLEDFELTGPDGLINMLEYLFGSDPHLADGDGDGISDFDEVMNGTDPGVSRWDGTQGAPLTDDGGCGSGGHAPMAWVLVFAAAVFALRRRRLADVR